MIFFRVGKYVSSMGVVGEYLKDWAFYINTLLGGLLGGFLDGLLRGLH